MATEDKPRALDPIGTGPAVDAPGLTDSREPHPWGWLAAILLLAAGLRFTGLAWGLPDIDSRPDEITMIKVALQCGTGDFNPHSFFYPSLLGYVLFACYVALAGFWKLTGVIASPGDVFNRFAEDSSVFFLTARLISALAGTATVGVVYWLGRHACGTRVGLAAAFLLAVAWLPVRDSHFGCVDTPMAFLATLSLVPAWNVYRRGARRDYLWAGVLIGLAASMKYYGAAAAVAVVAAHLLRVRPDGERPRLADLVAAGLASAVTFLATSPFVLLNLTEFWRDFHTVVFSLQGGQLEVSPMRAWRYHLLYTLPRGLTVPIFVAGTVGLAWAFVRDWRRALVLFSYPLAFFALIGWSWVFVARYTTATWPFLALAAGWLSVHVAESTRRLGLGPRARDCAAVLAVALVGAPSLVEDFHLLRLMRGIDTRAAVATWAKENLPDGATVGWLGTYYGRPPLPQTPASLERRLAGPMQQGGTGRLLRKKVELARHGPAPQFLLLDLCRDPSDWNGELPEYLLTERYPLFWVQGETRLASHWLEKGGYQEVRRWTVTDPGEPLPYCDPQDGVYLPFGQMSRVFCSGPELVLYRRSSPSARQQEPRPPGAAP
jgi:hypothetical protein